MMVNLTIIRFNPTLPCRVMRSGKDMCGALASVGYVISTNATSLLQFELHPVCPKCQTEMLQAVDMVLAHRTDEEVLGYEQ